MRVHSTRSEVNLLARIEGGMNITRRIYFSLPTTAWHDDKEIGLTAAQIDLIKGLAQKINQLDYTVEVFARLGITDSPTATTKWSYGMVDHVMRQCVGAVFIGLPRWILSTPAGPMRLATEYSFYEAGVAVTLGLPRLVLREEGLLERVVFKNEHEFNVTVPQNAGAAWLDSPKFHDALQGWKTHLDRHRDVFLGYSGKSVGLAKNLKQYLLHLGATVLDWKTDFAGASMILERIREAAGRCSGAIFLFTKDDQLAGEGEQVAPRDNVVFEAGYFVAAKGKQRVLIVREQGVKLPADLGGDIYAALTDQSDITPIEHSVRMFVEQLNEVKSVMG
jgi:hypothetical protein